MIGEIPLMRFRYAYGGDEFLFVEISEDMRLESYFLALEITSKLREKAITGIIDICPANSSFMIRFNPDHIHPDSLIKLLKDLEKEANHSSDVSITSRIVDVPILFDDPWSHEAIMRFRDRHQEPEMTDIEYSMKVNGFEQKEDFFRALTDRPYIMLMVAFMPGLCTTYQLTSEEKHIQAPKYVKPRTFTPERAFGIGGAFACIYPVDAPGGYQLVGRAAAPVLDKDQRLPDFKESMIFPRIGDIFKYRMIDQDEYQQIRTQVEDGTFKYNIKEITYSPSDLLSNMDTFSEEVTRRLYHD